jgi:hypothetical protein
LGVAAGILFDIAANVMEKSGQRRTIAATSRHPIAICRHDWIKFHSKSNRIEGTVGGPNWLKDATVGLVHFLVAIFADGHRKLTSGG